MNDAEEIKILIECDDEKHMAIALYLLQRAIVMREFNDSAAVHCSLRDAAWHCEQARQSWTKEAWEKRQVMVEKLFMETQQSLTDSGNKG